MAISNLGAGNIRSSDPQAVDYYKKIDSRLNTQKSEQTEKSKEIFSKTLDKVNKKINTTGATKTDQLSSINKQIDDNLKNMNHPQTPATSTKKSDGTDLAREEKVATELVNQVYGFLWNEMAKEVNKKPEGGFGEKMFQGSLWPELVKNASGKDMDAIKKAIVRDLKENRNVSRKQ